MPFDPVAFGQVAFGSMAFDPIALDPIVFDPKVFSSKSLDSIAIPLPFADQMATDDHGGYSSLLTAGLPSNGASLLMAIK